MISTEKHTSYNYTDYTFNHTRLFRSNRKKSTAHVLIEKNAIIETLIDILKHLRLFIVAKSMSRVLEVLLNFFIDVFSCTQAVQSLNICIIIKVIIAGVLNDKIM